MEFAAPRRLASPCDWLAVSEAQAAKADLGRCSSIPVTPPARTFFDLAAVPDEEALEETLTWLLRHGQSIARVQRTADRLRRQGRTGSASIKRLLAERGSGYVPTQSKLETKLARVTST